MTRKAHGRNAGPWLGANTLLFGVAGALVPLLEMITSSLLTQFLVLASISLLTAVAIVVIPVPTYLGQSMDKKLGKNARATTGGASGYWVEVNLSCAVFCLIGGKVTFSSYLKEYVLMTRLAARAPSKQNTNAPPFAPCACACVALNLDCDCPACARCSCGALRRQLPGGDGLHPLAVAGTDGALDRHHPGPLRRPPGPDDRRVQGRPIQPPLLLARLRRYRFVRSRVCLCAEGIGSAVAPGEVLAATFHLPHH